MAKETSQPESIPVHANPGAQEGPDPLGSGLLLYYLTSLVVVLGVVFGHEFLKLAANPLARRGDIWDAFANWDGQWYVKILHEGYSYDPHQPSSVAFFPAFPLLGRFLVSCTGLRPEMALLLISHVSLAAAFVLLAAYVRLRCRETAGTMIGYVLLTFGLWPTTCFWRMAYSESMFILLVMLTFYGMERRWPVVVIALVIGLATATRSLGVALVLPFLWHTWSRPARAWQRWLNLLGCGLLVCWGLAAFVGYQWVVFGEPLAFVQTQSNWRMRPPVPWSGHLWALLSLEPLWGVCDPASPCFWQRFPPEPHPLFSLHLANPVYFLAAAGLTALGWWKGWLTGQETLFAAVLLAIPYGTRSYEMCSAGLGRFAATAWPQYLVLGHLLTRLPAPLAAVLLCLGGFLLGIYGAMFAAWYRIF